MSLAQHNLLFSFFFFLSQGLKEGFELDLLLLPFMCSPFSPRPPFGDPVCFNQCHLRFYLSTAVDLQAEAREKPSCLQSPPSSSLIWVELDGLHRFRAIYQDHLVIGGRFALAWLDIDGFRGFKWVLWAIFTRAI